MISYVHAYEGAPRTVVFGSLGSKMNNCFLGTPYRRCCAKRSPARPRPATRPCAARAPPRLRCVRVLGSTNYDFHLTQHNVPEVFSGARNPCKLSWRKQGPVDDQFASGLSNRTTAALSSWLVTKEPRLICRSEPFSCKEGPVIEWLTSCLSAGQWPLFVPGCQPLG